VSLGTLCATARLTVTPAVSVLSLYYVDTYPQHGRLLFNCFFTLFASVLLIGIFDGLSPWGRLSMIVTDDYNFGGTAQELFRAGLGRFQKDKLKPCKCGAVFKQRLVRVIFTPRLKRFFLFSQQWHHCVCWASAVIHINLPFEDLTSRPTCCSS